MKNPLINTVFENYQKGLILQPNPNQIKTLISGELGFNFSMFLAPLAILCQMILLLVIFTHCDAIL